MEIKILKFGATWCQPCRVIDPFIKEVEKETGIESLSFDSDTDVSYFTEYKVMSVPTIIITVNGEQKERITGITPKARLISLINKYK